MTARATLALPGATARAALAALALAMAAAPSPAAAQKTQAQAADPGGRLALLGGEIARTEAALADARAALRAVARSEAEARGVIGDRDADAFHALAALDRIGRAPPLAFFAHPQGPVGAARAAMALQVAAPALAARATQLRAAIAALNRLAGEGRAGADRMRAALARLQTLQGELADRLSAPERAAALAAVEAALAAPALPNPALEALLAAFGDAADDAAATPGPGVAPAVGWLMRGFDADFPGAAVATAPYAVVRAPLLSTLRHVVRTPGAGLTVVLEPQAGALILLRGLGAVSRAPGEVLAAGEPLGAMGGPPPAADEFLIDASRATGTIPDETLYIELRRGGVPTDPAAWFPPADAGAADARPADGRTNG